MHIAQKFTSRNQLFAEVQYGTSPCMGSNGVTGDGGLRGERKISRRIHRESAAKERRRVQAKAGDMPSGRVARHGFLRPENGMAAGYQDRRYTHML